jgi:fructosamine-3-kinase
MADLRAQLETALGQAVTEMRALHGGSINQVSLVTLADGSRVVVKDALYTRIEAKMLRYLKAHSALPVPDVIYDDDWVLVMTYVEGDSRFGAPEQQHAAELIAALHSVKGARYGFEYDTVIGALYQPNPLTDHWIPFFRDHRLMYMAKEALDEDAITPELYHRLEALAGKLDQWLTEPEHPSLLHGDLWTTNMLAANGRITGFIDPAVYYGHPEIELAFTTLFDTFGRTFFQRYAEIRPIAPGFFEERRSLYNLYPLLVHVRIFGGGYTLAVDAILRRFGV